MSEPSTKQGIKIAIIWGVVMSLVFFGVVALVYAFITMDRDKSTTQSVDNCYTESVGRYEQEYCNPNEQDAYDAYIQDLKYDAGAAEDYYYETR